MPRISQLPSLTTADDSDEIAIVDVSSSTTKKITRRDLLKSPLPTNSVNTAAVANNAITADKVDFTTFPIQYNGGGLSADANTKTFTPSSTGLLQVTAQGRRNSGSSGDLVLTISATGVSNPRTSPGVGSGSADGFASTVYLATVTAGVSVTITITAGGGALANSGYTFCVIPGVTSLV